MRRRPSWHAILALVAAVLCAVGLGLAAHFQTKENADQSKRLAVESQRLTRDEQQAVDACDRLNQQIVQNNRASLSLYGVLKLTLTVNEISIRSGQVAPSYRKYIAPTLTTLKSAVAASAWTPPTDCSRTVKKRGLRYQLASPIPFSKRMPPQSALVFKRS